MLTAKRQPATVGEILVEEFMQPMGLTQAALAEAMGVQRKHVNELCNNRRTMTAATALILARVFGNSPDFWLNVQRRSDLWEAMNSPRERERIERATPLGTAARMSPPRAGIGVAWRRIGRPINCGVESWTVIDHWPERVPVADAELGVFEASWRRVR